MLTITSIDRDKCIKCERCMRVCPVKLFSVEREDVNKHIVFGDPHGLCIKCGHCVSICPTQAVEFQGESPVYFEETEHPEKLISYDTLMKFLRARRSVRMYKDEKVPKQEIKKILRAMKYAPTASNKQKREFIIITDEKEIASLAAEVRKMMYKAKRLLKWGRFIAPFVPGELKKLLRSEKTKHNLKMFLERTEEGEDLIFFHAPCVIILHSPKYAHMAGNDAGLAFTHGMLAAQSLGLGTCWIGYAQEYIWRTPVLKKELGIPKKHEVYGVMVVGYPEYPFQAVPPRRPLKVKWIAKDEKRNQSV